MLTFYLKKFSLKSFFQLQLAAKVCCCFTVLLTHSAKTSTVIWRSWFFTNWTSFSDFSLPSFSSFLFGLGFVELLSIGYLSWVHDSETVVLEPKADVEAITSSPSHLGEERQAWVHDCLEFMSVLQILLWLSSCTKQVNQRNVLATDQQLLIAARRIMENIYKKTTEKLWLYEHSGCSILVESSSTQKILLGSISIVMIDFTKQYFFEKVFFTLKKSSWLSW